MPSGLWLSLCIYGVHWSAVFELVWFAFGFGVGFWFAGLVGFECVRVRVAWLVVLVW